MTLYYYGHYLKRPYQLNWLFKWYNHRNVEANDENSYPKPWQTTNNNISNVYVYIVKVIWLNVYTDKVLPNELFRILIPIHSRRVKNPDSSPFKFHHMLETSDNDTIF